MAAFGTDGILSQPFYKNARTAYAADHTILRPDQMRRRARYGTQRDLGQKYCKVSCKNRFLDDCHYILYSDSFLFLCYYIQNKDIILDYSILY